MIQISEKDGKVIADIKGDGVIGTYTFPLDWNPGQAYIAKLLAKNLREHLDWKVRRIKAQAYEAGYRAGRSKKRKATCFTPQLAGDV